MILSSTILPLERFSSTIYDPVYGPALFRSFANPGSGFLAGAGSMRRVRVSWGSTGDTGVPHPGNGARAAPAEIRPPSSDDETTPMAADYTPKARSVPRIHLLLHEDPPHSALRDRHAAFLSDLPTSGSRHGQDPGQPGLHHP